MSITEIVQNIRRGRVENTFMNLYANSYDFSTNSFDELL